MAVTVELNESEDTINLFAEFRYKELCASIPGSSWKGAPKSHWTLPLSWSSCLAARSTFRDDLVIGPKLSAWATNEVATRIAPATALRLATSVDEGDPALYPHQRAGVKFLATAKAALLADQPGLGKTATAIRGLAELQKNGTDVFPCLVVVPNSIKGSWEREFATWWPGVNVQVIGGTATQRKKQFELFTNPRADMPMPHVVVINWESLRSHSRLAGYGSIALKRCPAHGGEDERITATQCEVHERELNHINFKSVIADEIHRSKDPKSKQTRALWAAAGDAEIRFAMTGTPIGNDVVDLWAIMHFVAPNEWPGKTKWIDRTVDVMYNAFGNMAVIGVKPEMDAEFHATLDPRMRRMLKAIVLPNLPPIIPDIREVEMSPKQKKAYEQMRDQMIAELESGHLEASSSMDKTLRLLQFASSYAELYTVQVRDKETGEMVDKIKAKLIEPSASLDALMTDILDGDFDGESVAVSSVSIQMLDLLSARFEKAKIPFGRITGTESPDVRQKSIDVFQEGRTKWIFFTAAAGGVGVTLTAASRLIRLQRPYSLIDDIQVNDRVHRIGSEIHESIIITDYVVKDTVQTKVTEILDTKADNFEAVVKDKDQLLAMLLEEKRKK